MNGSVDQLSLALWRQTGSFKDPWLNESWPQICSYIRPQHELDVSENLERRWVNSHKRFYHPEYLMCYYTSLFCNGWHYSNSAAPWVWSNEYQSQKITNESSHGWSRHVFSDLTRCLRSFIAWWVPGSVNVADAQPRFVQPPFLPLPCTQNTALEVTWSI